MKKLGLVVGSLALATIGGVYANWVYLTDTDISVNHRIAAFGMTDITSGSAQVGAYSVEDNIATFEIDQKDTTTPDYTAVLVRAYTDSSNAPKITIKLTTNVGASADIVENGIETYVYFGFTTTPTYDDPTTDVVENAEIFSCTYDIDNYITIGRADNTTATYKWEKVDGTLQVTLNIAEEDLISLNTFVLDSIEENKAFEESLSEFNIYVTSKVPGTGA
ncbi:MAG: hypothetical protein IJY21_04610 [Clostridia bacterium]|nr:hypothetical protein [Clostridia bacterium]